MNWICPACSPAPTFIFKSCSLRRKFLTFWPIAIKNEKKIDISKRPLQNRFIVHIHKTLLYQNSMYYLDTYRVHDSTQPHGKLCLRRERVFERIAVWEGTSLNYLIGTKIKGTMCVLTRFRQLSFHSSLNNGASKWNFFKERGCS